MTRDLAKLNAQIFAAIYKIQNFYERELFINCKMALDDIRAALSKVYERYAKAGKLTNAEMTKYNRMMNLHTELTDILGPTFSRNGRLIEKLSAVQYDEAFFRTEWAIDQHTGVALKWGLVKKEAVDAAVKMQAWRDLKKIGIQNASRETMVRIDRAVTQSLIRGDSYPKMAKGIKAVLDKTASSYITIARTEGQRAAVMGQQQVIEQARDKLDIDVEEIWDATLDGRTRPEHGALDGKAADPEKGWYVPALGTWVAGPMQSGEPSFDINCRCRVRPQIKGYGPKVRRIRDEGVVDYQTYDEWAKTHAK